MTPQERAEHIKNVLLPLVYLGPPMVPFIAAEIEAAVNEETFKQTTACNNILKIIRESIEIKAKEEAYEDAAKIVEENTLKSMAQDEPAEKWLANLIRARAKEFTDANI